jgi:hypothetical protein
MDDKMRKELQFAMETQFRHKFYLDPKFKFLPSLGIREVLQGFGADDVGFIGVLRLVWISGDTWRGEWHDDPKYIVERSFEIEVERSKLYNIDKVMEVWREDMRTRMTKQELVEEDEPYTGLLN